MVDNKTSGAAGFAYSMDGISKDSFRVAVRQVCDMLSRNLRRLMADFKSGVVRPGVFLAGLYEGLCFLKNSYNYIPMDDDDLLVRDVWRELFKVTDVLGRQLSVEYVTEFASSYCSELEGALVSCNDNVERLINPHYIKLR